MSNELIWFLMAFATLGWSILIFWLYGRDGLMVLIMTNIVFCNIEVLKLVTFFGYTTTLGNILYGSIFEYTELLGEVFGKKEARRGVWFGFIALILMVIISQFMLWFQPDPSDTADLYLQKIFLVIPRIVFASFVAYLLSQHHDVWIYDLIHRITKDRHLWLRNNLSTLISQFIDTSVFVTIAFLGTYPSNIFWQIFWTTYFIKALVAIIGMPFIYIGRYIARIRKFPGSLPEYQTTAKTVVYNSQ